MEQEKPRPRLDEILLREKLVSEVEIKQALLRQKAHGGKFGSQLLYHRAIDEAGLVKALSVQFNCEGVVLSQLEIPDILLKMIPKKVALSRRVIPFDYDTENNILKVACENPEDQNLIKELNFVARGKEIKLYVAAELALNTVIAKYYLGRDTSLDDNLLLEIPDFATNTDEIQTSAEELAEPQSKTKPCILLVTDEIFASSLLQPLLERDNYRVVISQSANEAVKLLGEHCFHTAFIKDTVSGDYLDLIDRIRKISPKTAIRYYDSASSLLLGKEILTPAVDLLLKNLELYTSLLSSTTKLPVNHAGRVGQYTDKLCRHLGLPDKERLMISNVAYVHDLARYYYRTDETEDNRTIIKLTIKLLASLNYPPVMLEMLRLMYIDLRGDYTHRLPIEVLGGNILTIIDLFCETVPSNEQLSLDKFDAIKKKLRALSGKLFLAEVVEAFVEMIQGEVLHLNASGKVGQIMIYIKELPLQQPLEWRLNNEGFRTVVHNSVTSIAEFCRRSQPDLMVLVIPGQPEEAIVTIDKLRKDGVKFEEIPTFLMTDSSSVARLTYLLEQGLEDVISLDDNLDILVTKINKQRSKMNARNDMEGGIADGAAGARGRLADMNLIDLIQALGPGRKTVRLTISANKPDNPKLTLYMNQGNIIFAEFNNLTGVEAVYEGLGWTDGHWIVEPITPETLPETNIQASNDSILMEGCRLMDERVKAGRLL